MSYTELNTTEKKFLDKMIKKDGTYVLMNAILERRFDQGVKHGLQERFRRCEYDGKPAIIDYELQCVWTKPIPFENLKDTVSKCETLKSIEDDFPYEWSYKDYLEHRKYRMMGEEMEGITDEEK